MSCENRPKFLSALTLTSGRSGTYSLRYRYV